VRFVYEILRTTTSLLHCFYRVVILPHPQNPSGDDKSDDAAITAYVVDTLLDVAGRFNGEQAKNEVGPIICDIAEVLSNQTL
jgi:hypothetical protein